MNTEYGLKELEKEFGVLTFGEFLNSFRKCEEINQKEFAFKLGIKQGSLCDIEKGRKIPSVKRAIKISKMIGHPKEVLVKLAVQDALRKENLILDDII